MEYIYTNEQGEKIKAEIEKWEWAVIYKDGKHLHQFADDGVFHKFAEIKQEEVAVFFMSEIGGEGQHAIQVSEDMKIFHYYRNLVLDHGTEDVRTVRTYCFGWKKDGAEAHHFILPDGRIIMGDSKAVDLSRHEI